MNKPDKASIAVWAGCCEGAIGIETNSNLSEILSKCRLYGLRKQ